MPAVFEKIFLRVRLGRFTFSFFCIIIKITYGIMPAIGASEEKEQGDSHEKRFLRE